VITAVVVGVLGTQLILPALGAAVAVFAFAFWLHHRLGGLTGDVYGAAIELGEVVMLDALLRPLSSDAVDGMEIFATCCYGRWEWPAPRSST
jgi:cobalamin synthase